MPKHAPEDTAHSTSTNDGGERLEMNDGGGGFPVPDRMDGVDGLESDGRDAPHAPPIPDEEFERRVFEYQSENGVGARASGAQGVSVDSGAAAPLVGGLEPHSALLPQASEAVITSNASNAVPVGHSSADISMSARATDSNASGTPAPQLSVVLYSDSQQAVAQDDPTSVPGTLAAIAPATDQETALVPFLDVGSPV